MDYIAHIRRNDGEIQTVKEHLLEVKKNAELYGEKLNVKHMAGLAGMLHDMGKYTSEFREYILAAVANPDNPPKRGSVDHSTAGGRLLFETTEGSKDVLSLLLSEIVGNTIISHHSYLHDYFNQELKSDYLWRVREKDIGNEQYDNAKQTFFENVMNELDFENYIDKAKEELKKFLENSKLHDQSQGQNLLKDIMFLTKYIFSCLIDADRTNAREFEENSYKEKVTDNKKLYSLYYDRLLNRINGFKAEHIGNTKINKLRTKMSEQCDIYGEKPSGIYTLSIPTGGGKTLASLRYALKHSLAHEKNRIIYVVPYTTIIEQNAQEVRKILDDKLNILEHHSNVTNDIPDDEDIEYYISRQQKLKLARDNWDSPIIFTTMVQFLDVFYAYGGSNVRRLHNLMDAVIIFDEVQKVPLHCVSLFNQALNFLQQFGNSSVVLCTATQPALEHVKYKLKLEPNSEIIKDIDVVIDAFKRVDVIDHSKEPFDMEQLKNFVLNQMNHVENILVILNTKKVVKNLYSALVNIDGVDVYHLSTNMCPVHRTTILERVRSNLMRNIKTICISTQLIEAGVDISFECVIRSLAGLDSIAQAAGRCNRHGERQMGEVYIIDYVEENLTKLEELQRGKNITKLILRDMEKDNSIYAGDVLSREAMTKYFMHYYRDSDYILDYPIKGSIQSMVEMLTTNKNDNPYVNEYRSSQKEDVPLFIINSYRTAAKEFSVIENNTKSVLVPYGEGKNLIAELNGEYNIAELSAILRKIQLFSINVYEQELEILNKNNSINTVFNDEIYVLIEGAYDEKYGLNLEGDSELDNLLF